MITAEDITIITPSDQGEETTVDEVVETVEEPTSEDEVSQEEAPESEEESESPESEATDTPSDDSWIAQETDGLLSSREDLAPFIERFKQLEAESNTPKEPTFKNEAQKQVYDFALKYGDGKEMEGANRFFQVQGINLEATKGKDLLLENFLIDNPNLTRERGAKIFEGMMDRKYPEDDLEDESNEFIRYEFEQEENKAKERIAALQSEYKEGLNSSDNSDEESTQALIKETINEAFPKFGGLNMSLDFGDDNAPKFGEYDSKNPNRNVSFEIPLEEKEQFKSIAEDPSEFWRSQFLNEEGELDPDKYMNSLFQLKYGKQIQETLVKESYSRGMIAQLKKQKGIAPEAKPQPGRQASSDPLVEAVRKATQEAGWN